MPRREVTRTDKDKDGDIIALCNPNQRWSPREKHDAISDIDNDIHEYYVKPSCYPEAKISVVKGNKGKYLRSNWDGTKKNNLKKLPDCQAKSKFYL